MVLLLVGFSQQWLETASHRNTSIITTTLPFGQILIVRKMTVQFCWANFQPSKQKGNPCLAQEIFTWGVGL